MPLIVPKFGRKSAVEEIAHQLHQDRIHGRIKIGSDRREREINAAVEKKFGKDARTIPKHELYKVFKHFSIDNSDLVSSHQAEKLGEEFKLQKNDLDHLREMEGKHSEDIDE